MGGSLAVTRCMKTWIMHDRLHCTSLKSLGAHRDCEQVLSHGETAAKVSKDAIQVLFAILYLFSFYFCLFFRRHVQKKL